MTGSGNESIAACDEFGILTADKGARLPRLGERLEFIVPHCDPTTNLHDRIYAMRGDDRTAVKWESAANQRKALDALANTLKPAELAVPKQVLDVIPARPPGFGRHRELFPRTTGDAFDPLSPATVAADVTIGFTLQLDRAARMVAQHAVDATLPGLEEVIDRLAKEPDSREGGQALFDHFCRDMDYNLREMGIGDLSVPKEMQRIGQAFYGQAQAYRSALAADGEAALVEALTRNVYEGSPPAPEAPAHLAAYVREAVRDVRAQRVGDLLAGKLLLPKP